MGQAANYILVFGEKSEEMNGLCGIRQSSVYSKATLILIQDSMQAIRDGIVQSKKKSE